MRTYVKPRCEETHFRRARPISANFSDDSGLRHSVSRSCSINVSSWTLDRYERTSWQDVRSVRRELYLDGKVLVDFDRSAEDEDELHEIRELPRVSKPLKQTHFRRWLRGLHLRPPTLARSHGRGSLDDDPKPKIFKLRARCK